MSSASLRSRFSRGSRILAAWLAFAPASMALAWHGGGHGGAHSAGSFSGASLGYGFGYGPFGGTVYPGFGFVAPTFVPVPVAPVPVLRGLGLPMPPRELAGAAAIPVANRANGNRARAASANPARARELTEIGDRSFRGGNNKRAEERYQLALKADPSAPLPRVHLAQVALVRGDYKRAAEQLRSAVAAHPDAGWLKNAPDIQAIFSEPGDFAGHLAKLESHLQANPNDRDGWFVLGVEWYLSGRVRQASDVFHRIDDRSSDDALAVFRDVSEPPRRDPD